MPAFLSRLIAYLRNLATTKPSCEELTEAEYERRFGKGPL